LCKDKNGNERECKVDWPPEASNRNITPQMQALAQRIAKTADVDLTLSSGRRGSGNSCAASLHNCGNAVDIKAINGVDVGQGTVANPAALSLVTRVQGVSLGMPDVRENYGPLGLWNTATPGSAPQLMGVVQGNTSYFAPGRRPGAWEGVWNDHQDHVHIGIQPE
jgi:hypothetical protein